MATQHASLSEERWSRFTLDQQILMIGNEMNRAAKFMESADTAHLENCYERVLNLTDLTIHVNPKPTLRRELLRWRDLIAQLYVSDKPDAKAHRAAFKVLLTFTKEASKQRQYVLT
jgi:hypothetical protein